MPVTEVKSLEEFKALINSGKFVVFDFWATWCGPCRQISPVFAKMSDDPEYAHIEFYKVDSDDQPEISQEVGIRVLPTFILFKDGAAVHTATGAIPAGVTELLAKAA